MNRAQLLVENKKKILKKKHELNEEEPRRKLMDAT